MDLKKFFCAVLMSMIIFSAPAETFAESATEKLVQIETDTYGAEKTGAILDRISRLEKDFNGENRRGNLNARIETIFDSLYQSSGEPGIIAKINALEWNINREVNGGGIEKRITELEKTILGEEKTGAFSLRLRELAKASFGEEDIPMTQMQLPANTLVKVALVDSVNTKTLQVGDTVQIKIAEDVTVDGKLIFAKGLRGEGTVKNVRKAKGWTGRNGKVEIDFDSLKTMDGRSIKTFVGEKSKSAMAENQMIEGASLVAVDLKDDWNKILVHGKNLEVAAGTELYVQIKNSAAVYVLSAE